MWEDFDEQSVENDLRLLADAGLTHLRVFPLWSVFQPLHALYGPSEVYEYTFGEQPLPDTPAGRAGVSEEACEKFAAFCALAEKYGLRLIVALITGHMSFRTYNPPAFDGKALLTDPTVLKWQVRFVKYFVSRFQSEAAIVGWDLGNEPIHMPGMKDANPDAFYVWCSLIADAIRCCDGTRPVISGLDNSSIEKGPANLKMIGEMCDLHTTHPYQIFSTASDPINTMKPILDLSFRCTLAEDLAGVPCFVQEFGATGYTNCSRKTEADFYRGCLLASLAHGGHGVMWWCAFDQGHLDYAPYRWNNIGSDYGFFDKDLQAKPIVQENLRFQEILRKLPEGKLRRHEKNALVIVPRDDGGADQNALRAAFMLAKQANFDVGFQYALDPIQDAPLYILPSISSHKAITKQRLEELLEKVEQGAVLYLSMDTALFRALPEITGVCFSYREQINKVVTMRFGEEELPIHTTFFLKPERYEAQVLAEDENGDGVFFCRPYGKGQIYFLSMPMEKHLSQQVGAFFKEGRPAYESVYRELAQAAGIDRIAQSDHPFVRLTEHRIDDDSWYVFAINYSNRSAEAKITAAEGYELQSVFGSGLQNGTVMLRENDGALFKAVRKA